MNNVPFKSGYLYDSQYNAYTIEGIIDYDGKRVKIEYQIRYPMGGGEDTSIQSESIPVEEIRKIQFKSSIFSKRIIIEAKSLKYFDTIPASDNGTLTLPIHKSAKDDAIRLSNSVNLKISEMNLDRLSGD